MIFTLSHTTAIINSTSQHTASLSKRKVTAFGKKTSNQNPLLIWRRFFIKNISVRHKIEGMDYGVHDKGSSAHKLFLHRWTFSFLKSNESTEKKVDFMISGVECHNSRSNNLKKSLFLPSEETNDLWH